MIKESRSDKIFDIIDIILLAILLLVVAYPLYFIVIASVSDPGAVISGRVILWPANFSLAGFQKVIQYKSIWTGYGNTLIYVASKTLIGTAATLLAGYALSRKTLGGRRVIMLIMTFTMFFSGGMIPEYLLVGNLGLTGSRWAEILLGCVSVYNIIIARTFMEANIPNELVEAASIDGCRPSVFFVMIAVPLSPALIAILVLFYAVAEWNSWFNAMLYLRDESLLPLQYIIRQLIIQTTGSMSEVAGDLAGEDMSAATLMTESIKYAAVIVSTLPIMCVYPFVQKYFVKGVMVGAIKG